MSDGIINREWLKAMAQELNRPLETLYALSNANDPFMADQPSRRERAEWFAGKVWKALKIQPGAHLRRIHYVLVSQKNPIAMPSNLPYRNTDECWQMLCIAVRDARYLGLIPPRAVVDRRSADPSIYVPDEFDDAAFNLSGGWTDYQPPGFTVPQLVISPPTIPQRFHVEIWCEKSTMNDVLLPLGERYGVNIITGTGELSHTRCEELVDRAEESQRPVRILYVSDFDPAGASMPVAVARKIEFVLYDEALQHLDIQVRPVVLTHDQTIQYRLPRTPIKESEKRAAAFEARFGEGATELDALEALHPGELERILSREIGRYYDADLPDRIANVAAEVQTDLDKVNAKVRKRHAKAIAALEIERKKAAAAVRAFERKAKPVLRKIERDLEAEAPAPDGFDWPEPDEGDEDFYPLFDSTRDYLNQIDRYKEHQGKPAGRVMLDKICEVCGQSFEAQRASARVCSDACRRRLRYLPGGERAS